MLRVLRRRCQPGASSSQHPLTSRSKRPGRRRAGSMASGLLGSSWQQGGSRVAAGGQQLAAGRQSHQTTSSGAGQGRKRLRWACTGSSTHSQGAGWRQLRALLPGMLARPPPCQGPDSTAAPAAAAAAAALHSPVGGANHDDSPAVGHSVHQRQQGGHHCGIVSSVCKRTL